MIIFESRGGGASSGRGGTAAAPEATGGRGPVVDRSLRASVASEVGPVDALRGGEMRPGVRLLTIAEVAERTRVPEGTLRYWRYRRRGEGPPSFRLGRRVMYREDDVLAWIAARVAEGSDTPPGE